MILRGQSNPKPSLFLGHSHGSFPFLKRQVALTGPEYEKHIHILGTTGVGKSKLNAHIAVSQIMEGTACSIIDPHSDLTHDTLSMLLDAGYFSRGDAFDKLWYIEFSNPDYFVPFNILKQPYPIQITVRNILEAFKRTWPALSNGAAPLFENIMQYTCVLLAENNLPLTLSSDVLTMEEFRQNLLANCTNEATGKFFTQRFDRWDERERTHNVESTLNKLSILTFSPPLERGLGSRENILDFRKIIDGGISVFFNLGNLDSETKRLLGSFIMVGFEQATLSRADIVESMRGRYRILVDEFPQFSSRSEEAFTTFLSESRKYKISLILSHQTMGQISERFQSAMQNTLPIFFGLGRIDSVQAAQMLARYDPYQVKHVVEDETQAEKSHPAFFGVQEQFEMMAQEIEDLRPREAYIKLARQWGHRSRTIKFKTAHIPKPRVSWEELNSLRDYFAKRLLYPVTNIEQTPVSLQQQHRVRRRVG